MKTLKLGIYLLIALSFYALTSIYSNYNGIIDDLTPQGIYRALQSKIPYSIVSYPDQELIRFDPQAVKWKIIFPPVSSLEKRQKEYELKLLTRLLPELNQTIELCEKKYQSNKSLTDFYGRSNSTLNSTISSANGIAASKAKMMLYDLVACIEERIEELGYSSSENSRMLVGSWVGTISEPGNTLSLIADIDQDMIEFKMILNSNVLQQRIGRWQLLPDGTLKIKYANGDRPDGTLRLVDENTMEFTSNQYQNFVFKLHKQ